MSAPDQHGRLMDTGAVMRELGITRWAAEAFMRDLKKVQLPGTTKRYVRRAEVERILKEHAA